MTEQEEFEQYQKQIAAMNQEVVGIVQKLLQDYLNGDRGRIKSPSDARKAEQIAKVLERTNLD